MAIKIENTGITPVPVLVESTDIIDVDKIAPFSPGQYSTDFPSYDSTKTAKNWIRDLVNSLYAILPYQASHYVTHAAPAWLRIDGNISDRNEFEIFDEADIGSASPWNFYVRFKYSGAGNIRDMVEGGSRFFGTPQWFKTSLWIPIPAPSNFYINICQGRKLDISFVYTDPGRTPVTIAPF